MSADSELRTDELSPGALRAEARFEAQERFRLTGCCGHQDQILWIDGIDIGENGQELRSWNRPACHWVQGLT